MADLSKHELKLSGSSLSELMHSILDRGASFRFKAKGESMAPFIKSGDILTVAGLQDKIPRIGDVAVVVNPANGSVLVHRVIGTTSDGVMVKGDNCHRIDGVFRRDAVIGIVRAVERGAKKVYYGGGAARLPIAIVSRSGLLNKLILPLARKVKRRSIFSGSEPI